MGKERKSDWHTLSGLPLPRSASPEDAATPLAPAGEAPYTRGIHSTMYRSRLWTMRQYAGFSSAEATNKRFKLLLERGQMGLSVAFDLPTQLGLDADDELSYGEVGKVGVSISSVEDMKLLFDGIPMDQVSTSMTINAPAMVLLAMYIVAAEEQGANMADLKGTIQNDILKEYIARGTYVFPPQQSMRLITDIFAFCADHVPKWNTISISGYHIREAGSTAVQELAFTLANALAYVEAAVSQGMDIDTFAPRLSFFFNCHNDFFEEISKFRAARTLWHDLMVNRYNPQNPKSTMLRFHTQVAGVSLTAQQPLNNVARVTIQALAAVIGGTQSLHTNSYDEALGLPTEASATVALRTQQIIAEESGVADTVDPIAGSWHVERLTKTIYDEALKLIETIESKGGALAAIEQGWQQQEIHLSAYQYLNEIEQEKRNIVGVNYGVMEELEGIPVMKTDASLGERQTERLSDLKNIRDGSLVEKALSEVERAAQEGTNLFTPVIEAVRARATLGEIMGVLKDEFGTYTAPSGF
ncbi:MAG TPA: methylmalonyl-CoA mutase [Candidatus Poseidoniales archaeon]|nr:MAG TPA: methylmalonyl-CoA mutase [Candidatus Poseidoniales archaeon]HII78379.1 methylmalonyl-CoA mutase [Poseidonia sp.]|tara:strand:- start:3393 stop:4976 length:1584 start_codon:yes stop_codon:yes gene_type:complete